MGRWGRRNDRRILERGGRRLANISIWISDSALFEVACGDVVDDEITKNVRKLINGTPFKQ